MYIFSYQRNVSIHFSFLAEKKGNTEKLYL